ncbi:MAG: zeta toxin family protein [Planctomycetales bacterium]
MANPARSRRPKSNGPDAPIVVVLGGPNGAGKSTAAPRLLKGALGVVEFINADLIARGISPFDPEGAALAAGEVMLQRMDALAAAGVSFGLESTLAARSLAPRLRELVARGYEFHLVFLYLRSADLAVARVADRVRLGGHNVPENTIRRRYRAGLTNFFDLYRPIAKSWQMFDNSHAGRMELIAAGTRQRASRIPQKALWKKIQREAHS